MHFFSIFDYESRWIFLDNTSPGSPFEPDDLIGVKAWDVPGVLTSEADLESVHRQILKRKAPPDSFGFHWQYGDIEYWYQVKTIWLGMQKAAYLMMSTQINAQIKLLTPRERDFLAALGLQGSVLKASGLLQVSSNTGYTYLRRMQEKTGLTRKELNKISLQLAFTSNWAILVTSIFAK